jgi:DNA-binding NarL/FixJ family response regulator
MLLSKKEKEKLVIKLANEGKTTREITKEMHMSLKSIVKIWTKILVIIKVVTNPMQ